METLVFIEYSFLHQYYHLSFQATCQQYHNQTILPPAQAHTPRKCTASKSRMLWARPCRGARAGQAAGPAGYLLLSRSRPPVGTGAASSRFRYAASLRSSASRAALSHGTRPSLRPRAGRRVRAAACVFARRIAASLRSSALRGGLSRPRPHARACQRLAATFTDRPPALRPAPSLAPRHGQALYCFLSYCPVWRVRTSRR